jgi:elongation factor G
MTQGNGTYSMELSHYEPVPPNIQQQLAAEHKAHRKEEED